MRSCHAQGSCQRPSRHGRSKFYLVTPFWNLKRMLAPRTRRYYCCCCRCYCHCHCPLPPTHARKSAVGLRVGDRDGKPRVSKLPAGPGPKGLGRLASMSSQIRAAWPGSRSIDGHHHVAHDSRGYAQDQLSNQTSFSMVMVISADDDGQTFGPNANQGPATFST